MQKRNRAALLLAVTVGVVTILALGAHGAVLGIDLGTHWAEAAVLRSGFFDVVENEQSDRKTATAVGFARDGSEERVFGEVAVKQLARFPAGVVRYPSRLLGKRADAASVAADAAAGRFPFALAADAGGRGTAAAGVAGVAAPLRPEEAVGMVLRNIRAFAERATGTPLRDAVITTHAFATHHERRALLDAAGLAGLNVLALVSTPSAFAVTYGMERASNETRRMVIVDMGASALEAALVSVVQTVAPKTNRTTASVAVQGVAWDAALGGRDFVARLTDILLARAGLSDAARDDPRMYYRAEAEAARVIEVLSVNRDAGFKVSTPERDYDGRISREEFDAATADLVQRIAPPILAALQRANWTIADIDYVQIVGGATRIPAVQQTLRETLGKEELQRHLSSDEGGAFGATYLAAHHSSAHRSHHDFVLRDVTPFSVEATALGTTTLLFRAGARIGSKKTLTVFSDTDFTVDLAYAEPSMQEVPSECREISRFSVTGVPPSDRYPNMTGRPKTQMHFVLSPTGIIELSGAETEITAIEYVAQKQPSNATTANATATTTEEEEKKEEKKKEEEQQQPAASEDGNTEADSVVLKPVTRYHRVALKIARQTLCIRDLTAEELAASRAKLDEMDAKDTARKELAEARNSLEAYIYNTRNLLSSSEDRDELARFAASSDLDAIDASLSAALAWLEDESDDATTEELRKRLAELRAPCDKIIFRKTEAKLRPQAAGLLRIAIQFTRTAIVNTSLTQEVSEDNVTSLTAQVAAIEAWLAEKETDQAKLPLNADPVFLATDVDSKVDELKRILKWLGTRPKKKPPTPAAAENATAGAEEQKQEAESTTTGEEEEEEVVEDEEVEEEEEMPAKEEL